jgi:hypothetical protein
MTMLSLGAIGLTGGFYGSLASMFGVHLGRADLTAPDDLSRFGAHGG